MIGWIILGVAVVSLIGRPYYRHHMHRPPMHGPMHGPHGPGHGPHGPGHGPHGPGHGPR